jgi:phosphatidylinositol glycan class B
MHYLSQKTVPWVGLSLFFTAAIFSKGFHHFDEHFQILEFAGLKLGMISQSQLAWEYSAKMRSALQPAIVVWLHQTLKPLNGDNPFLVTAVLRFFSALLSFSAFWALAKCFGTGLNGFWKKILLVPLSFFFSLGVYNGVRFSSENWGAIFFVFGLVLAVSEKRRTLGLSLLSGIFLGISFLFRFQMGIAIFGLFCWLLLIQKERFSLLVSRTMGLVLMIGVGVLVDHWFYGRWPLSFWNYFNQNLLMGRAAAFGVHPWYEYLKIIVIYLIPPFSIFFLFGLCAFFYLFPKHVLSFCLIPFLLVHSLIDHKEPRFIFPLLYFFPVILAMSFQKISEEIEFKRLQKLVLKTVYSVFLFLNGIFLIVALFFPADQDVKLYQAIYQSGAQSLVILDDNPFQKAGLEVRYYLRPGLLVEKRSPQKGDLVITRQSDAVVPRENLVYESFPYWLTRFNFNHWVERTKRWRAFWK